MALKPTSKKVNKTTAAPAKAPAASKSTPAKATKPSAKPAAKAAPVVSRPVRSAKPVVVIPKDDRHSVDFTYYAPQAGSVLLAGDFTKWESAPVALKKQETGVWTTTIALPPGRYQYRLLVDGQWQNDPECSDFEPNEFGSANCIRQVAA